MNLLFLVPIIITLPAIVGILYQYWRDKNMNSRVQQCKVLTDGFIEVDYHTSQPIMLDTRRVVKVSPILDRLPVRTQIIYESEWLLRDEIVSEYSTVRQAVLEGRKKIK